MSYLVGSGLTRYGRHDGSATLDLMSQATDLALADAALERGDIDAVVCGYSTTLPHLMLATVFAEHYGLHPSYAHAVQLGGATGFALVMLAHQLVSSGAARRVLVVAGENRLTGQSRDSAMQTLAQVGHPVYEVPLGTTIPAYYGLVASRYMHEHGTTEADFAELAVAMRRHAVLHEGAQFRDPITVADVMASRPIATPLKILDCCPVSDGGCAFVVAAEPLGTHPVRISGVAQHHNAQHISALASLTQVGARDCTARALDAAGRTLAQVEAAAIYDSFTITLTMLLEEIGLAPRGRAAALAREGHFDAQGAMPLNLHGGLLSYGHCGVGGAMAHLAETHLQMTGRAGARQAPRAGIALLHGDGGVLSSHVSLVLESCERKVAKPVAVPTAPAAPVARTAKTERAETPSTGVGAIADWTDGGDRLVYRHCLHCGHDFYFRRSFCPVCGSAAPEARAAIGTGLVHAVTSVLRAASEEFRAIAPYRIILVDLTEGVRVMAHGEASLRIGDPVVFETRRIAGKTLPCFKKETHVD